MYPSFLRRRMVGGGDPFYLKFWVSRPRWSEIASFQSIFVCSASAVAPSKKVQLIVIGSQQCTFQCTLFLYPQRGLKTAKWPFSV